MFSIQILTFPFNNCSSRFQNKMKYCRPPSFWQWLSADHRQIMGRSWAIDSCRKILKISAFFDTVFFPKNYANLRFSLKKQANCKVVFADRVLVFLGKTADFFDRISISHIGIVFSYINDAFHTWTPVCFANTRLFQRGRSYSTIICLWKYWNRGPPLLEWGNNRPGNQLSRSLWPNCDISRCHKNGCTR